MAAGSKESLKQVARRVVCGNAPKNPAKREEIPVLLPDPYADNVIFDNESAGAGRMIIFASQDGLDLLVNAEC